MAQHRVKFTFCRADRPGATVWETWQEGEWEDAGPQADRDAQRALALLRHHGKAYAWSVVRETWEVMEGEGW